MSFPDRDLGRLHAEAFDDVAQQLALEGGGSRFSRACQDTIAAWLDLVSRTSEAADDVSSASNVEVEHLRFELALATARKELCSDSADFCLKVLLHRGLKEWSGEEDDRVRSFERQLLWELSELILNAHRASPANMTFVPFSMCSGCSSTK